ncbi:MAG: polysaccharide deacetylase [Oscillospiraceae bacterium]|nr:polysaccharide deacetylase [Oscillospiraceae bacterium]
MSEERNTSAYPPQRRRRRKRRPKWQRMLHKYWPPIRFGLICLAMVLVLVMGIKGIVGGISGAIKDNRAQASATEETAPPETLSAEQLQQMAEQIGSEADSMAAGFDYLGAIELIQSFEQYQDYDFLTAKITEFTDLDGKLVSYPDMDKITHIFFHSLIVDNARAFDGDNRQAGYNQYMTTIAEFEAILESMYEKGYILVSPYDVAYEVTDANGNTSFQYGDIRIPEGRIPFLMSQDDVNYYGYMIGNADGKNETPVFATAEGDGFASRIVIGDDGYPTCEYMDANGNVTTGDYDLVPILERFIQEHPDFSYHGARAILGMTGYEGVFGYRTKPSYETAMGTEAYQKEVEAAKEVAQCLRDHGWILASHSYGHPAYGNITADKVETDSDKWENTVQTIIGETDIILYPHGSDIAGTEDYTFNNAKFAALYEDGYRYFFNVDSSEYWCQLGSNYYRGARRNLDGYRMYYNPNRLDDLFDVDSVFDPDRPTPVPKI